MNYRKMKRAYANLDMRFKEAMTYQSVIEELQEKNDPRCEEGISFHTACRDAALKQCEEILLKLKNS